jgi:hypothetical protein
MTVSVKMNVRLPVVAMLFSCAFAVCMTLAAVLANDLHKKAADDVFIKLIRYQRLQSAFDRQQKAVAITIMPLVSPASTIRSRYNVQPQGDYQSFDIPETSLLKHGSVSSQNVRNFNALHIALCTLGFICCMVWC